MQEIILFKTDEQDYPLEIIDADGGKWVTRKQLAVALGVSDLHKLHGRLIERGELKENVHWSLLKTEGVDDITTPLKRTSGGAQQTVVYSYRGIIRVAMASEGRNAIAFRDWAETVLYEVMTTGSYVQSDSKLSITASDREALKRIAIAHAGILEVLGITGNAAVLAVNQEIIKLTGGEINPLASSGNTYLIAEKQEQLFTATEIGKKVGLTAMKVNQRFCEAGYQVMNGTKGKRFYELTEKGKSYGQYLDTGKRHGNGQPVRAIKWFESVVDVKNLWYYHPNLE